MRSKIKSVLSIFLVLIMVVSVFPVIGIQPDASASCGRTESDAVNWANSQIGKSLNYDGAYGAQCVDLTMYYYCYLNYHAVRGNGCDYATNEKPGTWQRIKYTAGTGFVARPGDIAVWTYTTSAYGHVAIVTSADTNGMNVVEQNSSTGVRAHYYSYSYGTFWGVIRPDFENTPIDTTPPTISAVSVNPWGEGYLIACCISDNVGVTKITYPTWTLAGGQDDLIWHDGSILPDGTSTCLIKKSEHNNETGSYLTDIYAYDAAGNCTKYVIGVWDWDSEPPKISNTHITYSDANGFIIECDVSDKSGVSKVVFPTWSVSGGQDDLVWHEGTLNSDKTKASCVVLKDQHKNGYGVYISHVYAYDAMGNVSNCYGTDLYLGLYTNNDISPSGEYIIGKNNTVRLKGYAFNASGKNTDLYYQIDDNDKVKMSNVKRTDVKEAYGENCKTEYSGYDTNIDITLLKDGKHTIKAIAYTDTYYKVISTSEITVSHMSYSISYNPNGGVNEPSNQSKKYGTDIKLSSATPTRSGYTFKEWNTKADGTGTAYKPSETYTQNANLTLYAIWTLNHKHSYTSKTTKQPSCTATGVKTFTCSCGDTYTETISALGHDFGEWIVTKPATTSATGVETRYCSRCTAYETRTIPKLTDQTVELNNHNITMNYKATTQLVASNKNVEWTSSNTKVATVDSNGKVTATGTGNAVIKATIKGTDISDSCQISVSYAWWQWIIEILLLGFLWY